MAFQVFVKVVDVFIVLVKKVLADIGFVNEGFIVGSWVLSVISGMGYVGFSDLS